MGRVGDIRVDINWDASPVSSPATALIHCGKINKVDKVKSQRQGPILTFLGRHQPVTDFFFFFSDGQILSPERVNKFFLRSET